jgi:polysaccharide deacetylase family protein (PEP-CTERM system associated)
LRKNPKNPLDLKGIEALDNAGRGCNILTVDVEEWYHVNYGSADWSRVDTSISTVYDHTMRILEVLAETGSKATFFMLGCIAKKHARLIQAIDQQGHEMACHGNEHVLLYHQTPAEFRQDLKGAVHAICSHTDKELLGFRAPSSSITEKNPWALDILCEEGFRYDSSIFPVKNYMYGVSNFPAQPCRITTASGGRLLEIPVTTIGFWKMRIPFLGGFYLRVLPLMLQEQFMSIVRASGRPVMLYFHPSDISPFHIKIPLSLTEHFFDNVGRRTSRKKILSLLKSYRWTSIGDAFSSYL